MGRPRTGPVGVGLERLGERFGEAGGGVFGGVMEGLWVDGPATEVSTFPASSDRGSSVPLWEQQLPILLMN